MRLALLLLMACASPPPIDWAAVDAAIRQARWRTDHCAEPSSPKCDAMWLLREEIGAILKANREAFEQEHRAELERLKP